MSQCANDVAESKGPGRGMELCKITTLRDCDVWVAACIAKSTRNIPNLILGNGMRRRVRGVQLDQNRACCS